MGPRRAKETIRESQKSFFVSSSVFVTSESSFTQVVYIAQPLIFSLGCRVPTTASGLIPFCMTGLRHHVSPGARAEQARLHLRSSIIIVITIMASPPNYSLCRGVTQARATLRRLEVDPTRLHLERLERYDEPPTTIFIVRRNDAA